MRKKYLSAALALLFYVSILPWSWGAPKGRFESLVVEDNVVGMGGTLKGFQAIGDPAFTDNLTLYGNDLITKGPWVSVRSASSLSLAHDNAVALGRVLLIDTAVTVSDNTTLTAPVVVIPGGSFDIDNGVTLTFDNTFTADLNQQVFSQSQYTGGNTYPDGAPACCDGSGDPLPWAGAQVRFASSSTTYISPKWYGAKGDEVTIDQIPFFMASDSCSESGIAMWIPRATYLNPYVRLFKKGFNVFGNNSTFINNGSAQWNPIQVGDNFFRGKGALHPGVIETTATGNLTINTATLDVTSTTGFNVGDWVLVHSGTSTFSSAGNYIPINKDFFRIASKTSTQFTFEKLATQTFLDSDDLRVTHATNFPENCTIQDIITSGAWSVSLQIAMMSGVNVTFRNITPNGDAGWSIVTFAHNVIFDHLVVSGSGSGGSGRCVTKMTFRDSIFEPRPGGSGNSLAIEEVPDDTTIENCKLVGGFVYSNNDSTINKLKFINNTLYSAGLAMYLSGSIGSAIISGNHFRAAGDNNVNPSSLSTKYLTAHLYTGEDTNTRIVYTGNIFESINGDAMLYGIGTGGAYTAIHSSNNTLINVLPDTMSLISNAGLEKGPFETIRRTSVVDLWIDTQSISYDNTVLKYMYQLDNIATQVPSWTYNSTSKAFMLNVDIVGRGTASDNVYFLYKGVATVSQNDAVTTTAVVPTIVSSVSGGADASVAITSPSATSIKVALTIANQPMALIVKVEMLNPLKVLPY